MHHIYKRSIRSGCISSYSIDHERIVDRTINLRTLSSSNVACLLRHGLARRRRTKLPGATITPTGIETLYFQTPSIKLVHQRNWRYGRSFTTEASPSTVSLLPPVDDTHAALTSTTKLAADNVALNSNEDEYNNIEKQHETFQKLLYDDAAYHEAFQLLTTLSSAEEQPDDDWKRDACVQLFDAVIVRHRDLVNTYNRGFPTMAKTSNTLSKKSLISSEQLETLQQMVQMAEIANNCIEIIEPYLGARNALFIDRSVVSSSVDEVDDPVNADDENTKFDDNIYEIDNDKGIKKSRRMDEPLNDVAESGKSNLTTSTSARKGRKKLREIDLDLTARCNDVLAAWAQTVEAGHRGNAVRSYLRAIPQRAQFLLSRMELTVEDETYRGMSVPPSLLSYNHVLQAWAYSCEHLRAASAQRIFDKLNSKMHGTACTNIEPDGETYRHIIWAWALSRERRAAYIATGHLIKILRRLELRYDDNTLYDDVAIEPSMDDYHIVAQAWIRSEEKNSPGKARSLLKLMERLYKKGVTMLQPDLLCYKCVFLAAAKRHDLPDLGPLIDETLTVMKDRFIVPDEECYSAAIKTWKNAAIHQPDVTAANQQTSVRRAIELLAEMDVAHNQSMMVSITVSTENINDVLEALTVSTHPTRTRMAVELLDTLSRNSADGTSATPKATAESYIYTLRVCKTMQSMEKIAKGKTILWQVKDNYPELVRQHRNKSDNHRKDGIVDIFNEFVQLCASYQPKSDQDGLQVLYEALEAVRVMRSIDTAVDGLNHKLVPNASTFASLLIAVTSLLSPGGSERRIAVGNIFTMCCTDGMVDDHVLRCFREAATSDQYATMVESKSEIIEDRKVVPESWTINALGGKVKSVDGRKTVPLGIDGLLKPTMAMKEFQMRRLLNHRNRDLLRGGRWRQQESKHQYQSWKLYDATLMS